MRDLLFSNTNMAAMTQCEYRACKTVVLQDILDSETNRGLRRVKKIALSERKTV